MSRFRTAERPADRKDSQRINEAIRITPIRVIDAEVPSSVEEVRAAARTFDERGRAVRLLPAAPLMHGTGTFTLSDTRDFTTAP